MIVLDACVLIAFADPANAFHDDAKRILATAEPLMLTALSGAEIMVHPTSEQSHQWLGFLRELAIEVVPITCDDMEAIANVRRESRLKMPDSLVVWLAESRSAAVASFDEHLLVKAAERGLRIIGPRSA